MTTLSYYKEHAQDFFNQTIQVEMQTIYEPFLANLPQTTLLPIQASILDLGCGSGRDSLFFANLGFKVVAIDGCKELIDLAQQQDNRIDWNCLTFDQINGQNWHKQFSGIWACASLLHVPFKQLAPLLNILSTMLVPKGIVYISFKYGDSEREKDGRFFCDMNENRWQQIMQQLTQFNLVNIWRTLDNRLNRQDPWFNCLLKLN